MKRKMILAAAAYIAGLFFASFFTAVSVLTALFAAAGAYFIGRYLGMRNRDFILPAAAFVLAAGYMGIYTALRYEPAVSFAGRTGSFCGTVTDIRHYSGDKAQYTLSGRINGSTRAKITVYTDDLDPEYGDEIAIESCVFELPEEDYLYDNRYKLRSEGIFLTVSSPEGISIERRGSHRLRNRLAAYRERVCSGFKTEMGRTDGEFLAGMVFGQTSDIDRDTRTSLSRCGLAHMLAVSGLHISIATFFLLKLMRLLRLKRQLAYALTNVFMAAMIIMADSPISAVRAAIMLDILLAAGLFRRQNDTLTSLSAAVLLICIVQPCTIFSSGFWLSVTGTFGIGAAAPYFTRNIPRDRLIWRLAAALTATLCTMLCIMPVSMMFFDETSLISPVMNVILAPLFIVLLAAGLLYVFSLGAVDLLAPAKVIIDIILELSGYVSKIGFTHFSASVILVRLALLLVIAVALVKLILNSRRATALAAAAACAVLFLSSAVCRYSRFGKLRIAVLGRGSNAAVVVTYRGHTDIIDLSGHYRSADYVRKYLMQNGIDQADQLVLTRSVPSEYASYRDSLSGIDVASLWTAGDISPYSSEHYEYFSEEGFYCDCGSYSIKYRDRILSIEYGSGAVRLIPAGSSEAGKGLCVYYGSLPKAQEPGSAEEAVYLDSRSPGGMNNFEIELSQDGTNNIRRLKCHTLI